MISRVASLLAVIYVPTMWSMGALCGVMGVAALVAPPLARVPLGLLSRKNWVWLFGAMLLLLGAEIFVRAPGMALPSLARGVGAFVFVSGGVVLLIPTSSVILAEWCMGWPDLWLRILGLAAIGMAYLFYLGARVPYVHPEQLVSHTTSFLGC